MSFDVFVAVVALSSFIAVPVWLQIRTSQQLQFQRQQAQFWTKVLSGNTSD